MSPRTDCRHLRWPRWLWGADGGSHQGARHARHSRLQTAARLRNQAAQRPRSGLVEDEPLPAGDRAPQLPGGLEVRSEGYAGPRPKRWQRCSPRAQRRAPRGRSPKRPTIWAARSARAPGRTAVTVAGSALSENLSRCWADGGRHHQRHLPGGRGASSTSRTAQQEPARRSIRSRASWRRRRSREVVYGSSPYAHIGPTADRFAKLERQGAGAVSRYLPGSQQRHPDPDSASCRRAMRC